jgi:hypothetical protein
VIGVADTMIKAKHSTMKYNSHKVAEVGGMHHHYERRAA